jgi:hypothetical protein
LALALVANVVLFGAIKLRQFVINLILATGKDIGILAPDQGIKIIWLDE